MKPRKYDAPKQIMPANFPFSMMEKFYVVEPSGMITRLLPAVHAHTGEGEPKILKGWYDKRRNCPVFDFSSWAKEDGYRALDEVYEEEGREEAYKQYVKRQDFYLENPQINPDPMPDEWLPKLVLERLAGEKGPRSKKFEFPKEKKKAPKALKTETLDA